MDKTIGNQLNKITFILLLLNLVFARGFNNGGVNPWVVFDVPSNANDFSLSRANISDGTPGFNQFINPALLPQSKGISYGMSYNKMSLDRSYQALSINIPLPPQAAIGLSVMRSGTSNIQGKDIFNNNTNIISNHEMLGMISFGVSFNQYISLGVNIKASYANLDNNEVGYYASNKGIGFDGGFLISHPILLIGIKVENIESSKNWDLSSGDQVNSYEEKIPTIYKLGGHYNIMKGWSLYYSTDYTSNIYQSGIYRLGMKMEDIYNNFGLRLGYSAIYDFSGEYNSDIQFPTLGFDYSIDSFQLNYGIDFGSADEGISHIFTWTFSK